MIRNITLSLLASMLLQVSANAESIGKFAGLYRGVAPTDSSPIAMGEYTMEFSDKGIKHRLATGTNIIEQSENIVFTKMTKELVAQHFNKGSKLVDQVTGYATKADGSCTCYFFANDPTAELESLIAVYPDDSMMGIGAQAYITGMPVLLFYNEAEVAAGEFQGTLDQTQGQLPLLSKGGKL